MVEFILATIDLLKAEGRMLRRGVTSLWVELVLAVVAGALLLLGLVMIGTGAFLLLRNAWGAPWASFLIGALALALAGAFLWMVKHPRR